MPLASVGMGALRTAFEMLFDAVKSAQKENKMFHTSSETSNPHWTPYNHSSKTWKSITPKEGLQNFAIQMKEGARIGKSENLEMLRLKSCTELSNIKMLPKDIGEMSSLRKINMRQFMGLQQLKAVVCDEEPKYLWESFSLCINNVRIIVAKENINLNWIYGCKFPPSSHLTKMYLQNINT
ncbi:disease resistance protein [Pyrus ussuriensis x Pyrus communis]|uniref:Disease resistance protein n=1 Tax=Pyrus ussuriensis x Pyrus communis TaxID=2448454 RepID=A0A5N5H467_9ROSA|nr:disease resistance protein [Pyrus ussuriensis x Pyrus communis]